MQRRWIMQSGQTSLTTRQIEEHILRQLGLKFGSKQVSYNMIIHTYIQMINIDCSNSLAYPIALSNLVEG